MSLLFLCKRLLNFVLVFCVVTPTVVTYWRGTWYILDLFVFPDDKHRSAWITFAAGFGVMYLVMLVEDYLKAFLNERRDRQLLCLVMFYPLTLMIVTSWRGLWMLIDHYATSSPTSVCVTHAVGFLIILLTKTTSTIIAVPGYCISERNVDPSESIFGQKVCLRTKSSSNHFADITSRMVNSFITVFVIGGAVVSYWRGTWSIVKAIKHPDNKGLSSVTAICLGYGISSACYCLSEFIEAKRLNPPFPLWCQVLEQVFVYILGFGVVTSWVGMWYFQDIYLLPDQPIASALVCHFVGIVLLYLLQGSLNLIGSPAGCRNHASNKLEGLDMGTYLNTESINNVVEQEKILTLVSPSPAKNNSDKIITH